ncbi:hypothetical protein M407DRAFT_29321 [Tulasnella calospora MUT 4182]|uniref:Uncharacterized protein n=1 Tax=Tulasnella calospora MUT 4182 TaxID=1051891 RepID=A0A0C3LHZ1_9AGAM|nr:hypothetical protein M407DRAFT_29321 [Tulasnella calospora MUT 4182]
MPDKILVFASENDLVTAAPPPGECDMPFDNQSRGKENIAKPTELKVPGNIIRMSGPDIPSIVPRQGALLRIEGREPPLRRSHPHVCPDLPQAFSRLISPTREFPSPDASTSPEHRPHFNFTK